mgnify:CR=1 FL=1
MAHDFYTAEYRTQQAIEMRSMGVDYEFIAKELGYADRSGAWRAVKRGMKRQTAEEVSRVRWAIVEELGRIADAAEGFAMTGNAKAMNNLLTLVNQRLRIAQLS